METSPLIAADNTFGLLAALLAIVAVALALERTRWGQALSATLIILVGAMLLSNTGLLPIKAPVYSGISGVLVPLAIPLLLFRADLAQVIARTGSMLGLFLVAAVGTAAGAVLGALLIDIGADEASITGMMAASLIGGSMNFVATAEALEFTDNGRYVAALSADVVGAILFLALLLALPASAVLRRWMPSAYLDRSEEQINTVSDGPFELRGAGLALAVSAVICAVSRWLADAMDMGNFFILFVTVGALLVANVAKPLVAQMSSEFAIGTLFMYLFFAALGTGADVVTVANSALPMLGLVAIMLLVHLLVMILVGRWLKADLAALMIASNACILGPATAAALAAGRGWRDLVTPGMLVGVLGYAMGTFIGVGIARVLA